MPVPELAIANLLNQPSLTQHQIAEIVGVSRTSVARVAARVNKASKGNLELEQYQGLIRKRVPAVKRVATVEKVLEKVDSNPFAAMRAVEYLDGVLGLAPKQQQREQDSSNQAGPSLVFPAGTVLDIGIRARTPEDS